MPAQRPISMRVVFKFIMPAFGTFMVIFLGYGNPNRAWAVVPIALVALYFSAAEVRVENRGIRYRRFFSWKDLPQDVTGARCLPLPALGYIKFKHFLPPWGRLYYIVEREEGPFRPFCRTALMQAILSSARDGKVDIPTAQRHSAAGNEPRDDRVRLKWILIAIASLLAGAFLPLPWQHESATPHWPGILGNFWTLLQVLRHPAVFVIYAALLTGILIRKRFQGVASAAGAFLLGGLLSYLVRLL